jgi:hypothetical protein
MILLGPFRVFGGMLLVPQAEIPVLLCRSIYRSGRDIEHRRVHALAIGYCVKRFTDLWYVRHHCCIQSDKLLSPVPKTKKWAQAIEARYAVNC